MNLFDLYFVIYTITFRTAVAAKISVKIVVVNVIEIVL